MRTPADYNRVTEPALTDVDRALIAARQAIIRTSVLARFNDDYYKIIFSNSTLHTGGREHQRSLGFAKLAMLNEGRALISSDYLKIKAELDIPCRFTTGK